MSSNRGFQLEEDDDDDDEPLFIRIETPRVHNNNWTTSSTQSTSRIALNRVVPINIDLNQDESGDSNNSHGNQHMTTVENGTAGTRMSPIRPRHVLRSRPPLRSRLSEMADAIFSPSEIGDQERPPSYMSTALFTLCCCNMLFGVLAVIWSVRSRVATNFDEARGLGKVSILLSSVAIVIGSATLMLVWTYYLVAMLSQHWVNIIEPKDNEPVLEYDVGG